MQQPYIGLLDCNNFFVSCERLFRPELRQKPVVVLSSNDGCVVARSQEIKDSGVPMGVPYFKIKDTLKKLDATVFSSHFTLYRDISRRVFAVMREELCGVEQYSIDEAFFRLTSLDESVLQRVKRVVEQKVGIPVSLGLAATKTQAKYANQLAKRGGGTCVLSPEHWDQLVSDIPLYDIWGVGKRLELRCKQHRLFTVADLIAADPARVRALFGVVGLRLQQELTGTSAYQFTEQLLPQQSMMHSRSFNKVTKDKAVLSDALAYHVRHAAADLRACKQLATSVRVFIRPSRHGDFFLYGGSAEAVLPAPTNDTLVLLRTAQILLSGLYEPGVPYQKTGVVLHGLMAVEGAQPALFVPDRTLTTQSKLMEAVDALNHGRETVFFGSRLRTKDWQAKAEVRSPAYTTRWEDLATVAA
jgi:DNA polymerase V